MYDSLAAMIMFVRLFVQHIRFVLMFFAFFEVYEFIFEISFFEEFSLKYNDTFSDIFNGYSLDFVFYNISYGIPMFIVKNVYQIGHFLFTVTSHFFAYFSLVL